MNLEVENDLDGSANDFVDNEGFLGCWIQLHAYLEG